MGEKHGRGDYEAIVQALKDLGYELVDWVFSSPVPGEPYIRKVCRVTPGPVRATRRSGCACTERSWTIELQFRSTAQNEAFALREEVFREEERAVDALLDLEDVRDEVSWSYGPGDQDGFLKVRMEIRTYYDRAVGVTA